MPEHFRALVVILAIALAVFVVATPTVRSAGIDDGAFRRWRNLWFAVTLAAFVSHNFWLYAAAAGLLLWVYGRRERNPLALYFMVLLAVPAAARAQIPGIGPIESLFILTHSRLLALAVLLPLAAKLYRERSSRSGGAQFVDVVVASFVIWVLVANFMDDRSITGFLRRGLHQMLDIWLPYYVASRFLVRLEAYREVVAALVVAAAIAAVVAIFESQRSWLLYRALVSQLDAGVITYHRRDGLLRAEAIAGHSIALGYLLVLVFALYTSVSYRIASNWRRWLVYVALAGGVVAALARGPWVGAAGMLLTLWLLSDGVGRKLMYAVVSFVSVVLVIAVTPIGATIVRFLPFVGTVDRGGVDYRERLFEVSMTVFWKNPVFGDPGYLSDPLMEQMRQGEGIIDMVNTYLQVALPYGFVGFVLFVLAFALPLLHVMRAHRTMPKSTDYLDARKLARALIAANVGALIIIGTVSSVHIIPTMYWLLIGVTAGFARAWRAGAFAPRGITPGRSAANGRVQAAVGVLRRHG